MPAKKKPVASKPTRKKERAVKDWRNLARKPVESKRTAPIGLRVTVAERTALNDAAKASGQTLVDFILARCLD